MSTKLNLYCKLLWCSLILCTCVNVEVFVMITSVSSIYYVFVVNSEISLLVLHNIH